MSDSCVRALLRVCQFSEMQLSSVNEERHKDKQVEAEVRVKHTEKAEVIETESEIDSGKNFSAKRECEVCGKMIHKRSMGRHQREKHIVPKVTCSSCGIKISIVKLPNHIQKVHLAQQMKVQCNICKK
jgi:hypothetical protein